MFINPSPDQLRALLREVRSIAVVGLSPRTDRPSHAVASALQHAGYRILPVRPGVSEILGEKAYPCLADLPEKPDLVEVFRSGAEVGPIVDTCIALGLKRLWLQDGVINAEAAARAVAAGLTVVMDRCVWRDHKDLML